MKKVLIVLVVLTVLCPIFAKETSVYGGVFPYSFQRCYAFSPAKEADSEYSIGIECGYRTTFDKDFYLSADLLMAPYFFDNKVTEFVANASAWAGYDSTFKSAFGFSAGMGLGCSACLVNEIFRVYLTVPIELEGNYRLFDGFEIFLKARVDDILQFNTEIRKSSLSVLLTPVVGCSYKLGGNK